VSLIRYKALASLGDHFKSVLGPDIHQVQVLAADPETVACYPNLTILPVGNFEFEPFDVDEISSTSDTVTLQIGDFRGRVEIRLAAKSTAEREKLEERIIYEFIKDFYRRGVLVVEVGGFTIGGKIFIGTVPCSFTLEADSWSEEFAFDKKRFAFMDVECTLPALITVRNVYDIDQLVLALTEDLESANPAYDQVEVLDTGSLDSYPP